MTINLREVASTTPQTSLVNIPETIDEGAQLYSIGGLPRGALPGWPSLDELYSVAPGQWTVITGYPGSGKSELLDAMLVNMAERGDWEFCIYSPENFPVSTHLIKLIEKRVRKPFNEGVTPRMSLDEYRRAAVWVTEHFFWIEPEFKTPLDLIGTGLAYRQRGKQFGIVLDPWNTLDHERGRLNETDYVAKVLTGVTQLARASKAHVWLVVHPAKIQRNRDGSRPVPTPHDLIGSSHWWNKADGVICVHRDLVGGGQDVDVHVQKIRFKHIGHAGLATLMYDRVVGRYFELGFVPVRGEFYADPERAS